MHMIFGRRCTVHYVYQNFSVRQNVLILIKLSLYPVQTDIFIVLIFAYLWTIYSLFRQRISIFLTASKQNSWLFQLLCFYFGRKNFIWNIVLNVGVYCDLHDKNCRRLLIKLPSLKSRRKMINAVSLEAD